MKFLTPLSSPKKVKFENTQLYKSYHKLRPRKKVDSIDELKTFVPDWLTSNKDFIKSYKKMKNRVDIDLGIVCTRAHISRTKDERKALFNWVKAKPYFSNMPKAVVKKLCDKLSTVSFKVNETSKLYVVIKEGDEPNCLYIIYKGSVDIYMHGQKVNHRSAGEPLGENALDNDTLRTASAIAESNIVTLKLKRTDYEDIVLTIKKNEKKSHLLFIKALPIFQTWNDVKIMSLSHNLTVANYLKGEIIYEPSEPCHSFYIIKEGNVEIQTEVNILEENKWPVSPREWNVRKITKKIYHPVQCLMGKDLFGQVEILNNTCRETRAIAASNCVCFIIDRNDFDEFFTAKDKEKLRSIFQIPSREQIELRVQKRYNSVFEKEKILMEMLQSNHGQACENKKTAKWKKFVKDRILSQRTLMKQTIVKHTLENIKFSRKPNF